eukprot:4835879-Pyramimonas_sp.AAC.1
MLRVFICPHAATLVAALCGLAPRMKNCGGLKKRKYDKNQYPRNTTSLSSRDRPRTVNMLKWSVKPKRAV